MHVMQTLQFFTAEQVPGLREEENGLSNIYFKYNFL